MVTIMLFGAAGLAHMHAAAAYCFLLNCLNASRTGLGEACSAAGEGGAAAPSLAASALALAVSCRAAFFLGGAIAVTRALQAQPGYEGKGATMMRLQRGGTALHQIAAACSMWIWAPPGGVPLVSLCSLVVYVTNK